MALTAVCEAGQYGTKIAAFEGMTINGIKLAPWAEAEHRKKVRQEKRERFFDFVGNLLMVALLGAGVLFICAHNATVQNALSTGLHRITDKINPPDNLRNQALRQEKDLNDINR